MPDDLAHLLLLQDGVVTRSQALRFMTVKALYHRVESGRWRLVHRGVYLAHNGPVTGSQRHWIAVLATGRGHAVLAGLSALARFGFRGYADRAVHVLLPARYRDTDPPRGVTVHRTGWLPGSEVHSRGRPPSTMPARSLVDGAQWARDDDRARAIVAAGYQHTPPPRQAMDHRLRTPEGTAAYARRSATVETVFGHLKDVLGMRQLLTRGLTNVTGEINLAAATFNLRRLYTYIATQAAF